MILGRYFIWWSSSLDKWGRDETGAKSSSRCQKDVRNSWEIRELDKMVGEALLIYPLNALWDEGLGISNFNNFLWLASLWEHWPDRGGGSACENCGQSIGLTAHPNYKFLQIIIFFKPVLFTLISQALKFLSQCQLRLLRISRTPYCCWCWCWWGTTTSNW